MEKLETMHWYAFRISFAEGVKWFPVCKATTKNQAYAKVLEGFITKGVHIDCRSFEDETGARWQRRQWYEEYRKSGENE